MQHTHTTKKKTGAAAKSVFGYVYEESKEKYIYRKERKRVQIETSN